jgi:hypothetical protein
VLAQPRAGIRAASHALVRLTVAITVAVLLSCAVPLGADAARTARQASWRSAAAAKLQKLRRAPGSKPGMLGRARAATAQRVRRAATRVKRTAARKVDRVARAGVPVGLVVTWLGAAQADPAHQMKYVLAGIAIATVSAAVMWVRMIRSQRREQAAFYADFQSRFGSVFDDFDFAQASAAGGARTGGGWQPPRVRPPVPRPPPGETWPADLVAVLGEMARASDKDQLSKIYRRAAPRYHPDRGGNEEHAKTLNAYHTELQHALD